MEPGTSRTDPDRYRTDAGVGRSLSSRLLNAVGFPFLLYPPVAGVVWRASRLAREGRYGDDQWVASSRGILLALERAGCRVEAEGLAELSRDPGPVVIVGNHMSTLETFVLPCLVQPRRRVTFVVKRELLEAPVFGWVMRARDPVVVGRSNPRDDYQAVMEQGAARLAAGISIIIFPQTTRSAVFDPENFNSMGIKLARKAGVPVIPLALLSDAWTNGRLAKDLGRLVTSRPIRFRFGPPLAVEGTGARQHEAVVDFITRALSQWRAP
jgi:1-acyl-sn-glycerol-3-phosphate acyltransferase